MLFESWLFGCKGSDFLDIKQENHTLIFALSATLFGNHNLFAVSDVDSLSGLTHLSAIEVVEG